MANETRRPLETRPEPDAGHVPITEEFDQAKWTLPPLATVGVAALLVAMAAGVYVWLRATPERGATGRVVQVKAAQPAGQESVLAAIQVEFQNVIERPMWIRHVKATLNAGGQEYIDDAASAVDHERYFQALPELRVQDVPALVGETRIEAGQQAQGLVVVSFPVSKEVFDQRQQLSVTLELYDRTPLVIREKPE